MVCHHLLAMISIISSSAHVGTALRPIGEKGRVERYSSSLGVKEERKGETMGAVWGGNGDNATLPGHVPGRIHVPGKSTARWSVEYD